MIIKYLSRVALLLFLGLFSLSSCTKENSVTVIETEEDLKLGLNMTVNGTELSTNAVAAFCENDSTTFFIIANKAENLSFPLQTSNLEIGDFVYFTNIAMGAEWAYGTKVLGEEVTGFPGTSILTSDAIIDIESNDGDIVVGSSEGTLLGIDGQGNFNLFPYEMDFVAEIIQTSDFCD